MLRERMKEISSEFGALPNDMLRYSFLVELSAYVPPFIPEIMHESNLFAKCQSQVWIKLWVDKRTFQMQGTSDTLIIRGFIHVLKQLLNGCQVKEIASQPIDILDLCGLKNQISGTRGDGMAALLQEIQDFCLAQTEGNHQE